MKTTKEPRYPSAHSSVHISIYCDDPTIKGRMKRVAAADGRDFSNWFRHNVLSYAAKLVEQEEIRHKLPPYSEDDPIKPAGRRKLFDVAIRELPVKKKAGA